MSDRKFYILIGSLVILMITFPYGLGFLSGGNDYLFSGFFINHPDGHAYLAKMRLGQEGRWSFTLPYHTEPGGGGYVYLFYLGLGHIARILHVPLIYVFHGARIFLTMVLLASLANFWQALFQVGWKRKLAFAMSSLGSGLGWFVLAFGSLTADFLVAEAYPFLAAYHNPHFPFGLGLMVWLLTPGRMEKDPGKEIMLVVPAALMLGVSLPFGVVIVCLVLGCECLIANFRGRFVWQNVFSMPSQKVQMLFLISMTGGSILLYQMWLFHTDPVLNGWYTQNRAPSIPVGNMLWAFSPGLILAAFGWRKAFQGEYTRRIALWMVIGLGLVYIPWNWQRRFMTGLYIPVAGLAVLGIKKIRTRNWLRFESLVTILFLLIFPTNLMILGMSIRAAYSQDETLYYTADEMEGLAWLSEMEENQEAIVLAEPDLGLAVPVYTPHRVVYGHRETINAREKERMVKAYFSGDLSEQERNDFLEAYAVDYVLVESTSDDLDEKAFLIENQKIFEKGAIVIYEVKKE